MIERLPLDHLQRARKAGSTIENGRSDGRGFKPKQLSAID
jgi:hypothetical protein